MPVTSSSRAAATTEVWSRPCTARSTQLATANSSHTTQMSRAVGERNVWTLPSARPPGSQPRLLRPAAGRALEVPGGAFRVLLRGEPPDDWLAAMLPHSPRRARRSGGHPETLSSLTAVREE